MEKITVICDECGCPFVPEIESERVGDIEYTYFFCDCCGKLYMVSISDAALREAITQYTALLEETEHMNSELAQHAAKCMLEANLKRGKELWEQYIREREDG